MIELLLPTLLVITGAMVPQQVEVPAAARAAITAANAEWLPAVKTQDATTIAAPYAADGIFVSTTGVVATGRAAVAQLMRDRFSQAGKVMSGELVQDGLTRQGSLIYEWGHASLDVAREGAAPVRSIGRYLTVWRQNTDGRWEIVRNLSLPE